VTLESEERYRPAHQSYCCPAEVCCLLRSTRTATCGQRSAKVLGASSRAWEQFENGWIEIEVEVARETMKSMVRRSDKEQANDQDSRDCNGPRTVVVAEQGSAGEAGRRIVVARDVVEAGAATLEGAVPEDVAERNWGNLRPVGPSDSTIDDAANAAKVGAGVAREDGC
jgi:hypothetical protein